MSRTQRVEKEKDQNLLTAEFTTGQLTVLICVSLFVAMACFGLGILVARMDSTLVGTAASDGQPAETTQIAQEMETYTAPALVAQGTGTPSPATVPTAKRTPETPPPRNPYMDNTPRLTALPPLSPYRSLPVQAEAPTRIPRTDTAETTVPPPVAPTPSVANPTPAQSTAIPRAVTTEPPLLTPIDPDEPLILTGSSPGQPPAAQQPTVKPPAAEPSATHQANASGGKFGIQLAAFSGSDRRTRAESLQRRVRTELNVDSRIIPSADDVHYRVIVGEFATRESAAAACEDLRRKAGLSEAFVRPL